MPSPESPVSAPRPPGNAARRWQLPPIETYPELVSFARTWIGKLVLFAVFAALMKLLANGLWIDARGMWLWLTIALLALLALNTVLCSVESLRRKYRQTGFLVLMAPQVMHAGFLLIALAHLFSAVGGFKQVMQLNDGAEIGFPDGGRVQIANLQLTAGPMGMPTDLSAEVRYPAGNGGDVRTIRPNHPFFYQGFGIYLKDVALYPARAALIEIHREPGAGLALAGALLFTAGNIVLLAVRRGR